MSADETRPSRESVLDAFAAESDAGRNTLERYLRLYPEHAGELIDLSREILREVSDDSTPFTPAEHNLIDAAWSHYLAGAPRTAASEAIPLTADEWRAVARALDVPRQVVTALRERRISLGTIPRGFLQRFAAATRRSVEQLESTWASSPLAEARSYKADGKPTATEQVSFEQVLIEAGVADDKRARLLAEAN